MDTECQWVYDRMQLYRLMRDHPDWSPKSLAEAIGRSERWGRKWVQRFRAIASPTLSMFQSQSRAPKSNPRRISEAVKDAICELRETLSEQYHRPAGAKLIRLSLEQHTALCQANLRLPTSSRTISQILRERGYIQSPPEPEHIPLELEDPMAEWELDFCEIRLVNGHFEFFLVVDRGASRVVYLEGGDGYQADSALQAVCRLFELNGLPQRLRFDRDPRLVWSWRADGYPAPLVRLLHVLGVEPVICPPRRPDKKPYVERCIRTFKHEWLDRFSLETMADCYEALEAFSDYHNRQHRYLGRVCQGRTPDEAFPQLPVLPSLPQMVDPNAWLLHQHERVFRRRIRANGSIQVDKHVYYVDVKLAGQSVLVQVDAHQQCLWVLLDGKPLPNSLPLKDLHSGPLELYSYLRLLQHEARSIAHYREMMWQRSADAA